jgi:hypothetical protein
MTDGERLLPQGPGCPNRVERQVKDFSEKIAGENHRKIDSQTQQPEQRWRLPLSYERRYFMHAAIASTRSTITRSQTRPMPHIMPIGIVDISIIMNVLPSRAQFDRTMTHGFPCRFTA